ncbi:MAG: nitrate reductase [Pseudomonadota bacterium]
MSCASGPSVKTTCPYCGVGCGIIATPQQDGSVEIKGDPEHPANFGRLCSKGSALGETVSKEDRLLYPEVDGRRTDWDTALDLVAEKFSSAIAEYGPDSVAFYVSGQILTEDYYVANKLMKGFIGSANIDTNSRLCMASSVAGHKRAFGSDTVPGTYEDLEQADLVVLTGSNLAWCHPVIYQRLAAAKEARPHIKVVLIDPRRTMSADIADLHLAICPDGDVALFNGLLDHLARTAVLDRDYIEANTNGLAEALLCAQSMAGNVVADTGLSREEIDAFFDLFASTRKTVTVYSQGVNQSSCGTDKVNAILNCHLATGRIGRPGMGPFSITGQPNAMGGREVGGLANMLAAHMDLGNPEHSKIVQSFWQSPDLAMQPGLKAVDMFRAVADGRIKALWIMATNPADSLPDAGAVEEAISNCPFVVVSDVIHSTDTVRHAHVKLPAAAWGEKDGTVTNSERRISRQKRFLELPGEVKPDWWHLAEVARRMGHDEAFSYSGPAEIFREHASLSAERNDGARDFDIGGLKAISDADYDALAPVQWPVKSADDLSDQRFFAGGNFFTPDHKARFLAVSNPDERTRDADHPLILNTGRIRDHWHTMTRTGRSPRNSSHMGEPYCEIHPADALRHGISEASLVEVSNAQGHCLVRAMISTRQQEGSVFVPMHWTDQFASSGRVDTLVAPETDPVSGQPASKNVAVAIRAARMKIFGFLVSRDKPDPCWSAYWALARINNGWRMEFALSDADLNGFVEAACGKPLATAAQRLTSDQPYLNRAIWLESGQLDTALFTASQPVAVSRSWMVGRFEASADERVPTGLLAGRPGVDQPDKGPIVCSCFAVGANQIRAAIGEGHRDVAAIGKATCAGTNCGSCKSEISGLIHEASPIAAE